MSPDLGKTSWTDPEIADLRAEVLQIITDEGLTRRLVADESGVAEGTFGPWLNGRYPGDNAAVATKVRLWKLTRADRTAHAAQSVQAPAFQMTPTAKKYLTALEHAQFVGDMALIAGGPGTGKTAAIRQHQATRPRVFVATMDPSTGGVSTCLIEVLSAMGKPDAKGTPQTLSRQVCERFAEPGALLIIDEAQALGVKAVEQLRSIHDRTGVGLAFVGDETLLQLFGLVNRKPGYAQLSSRIGFKVRAARPTLGDVEALTQAWGLDDRDAVSLCRDIAGKPGALRGLTKVLLVASRLAGGERPTALQIREAFQAGEVSA